MRPFWFAAGALKRLLYRALGISLFDADALGRRGESASVLLVGPVVVQVF